MASDDRRCWTSTVVRNSAECLEALAEASYGAGNFEASIEAWEDLHSLLVRQGGGVEAGRAAAMIALYLMMDTGLMAPVRGWLRTAERHLDGTGDHPVRAIVAMVHAYERFMCGSMDEARRYATAAVEFGERFDVRPAVVIGRTCLARRDDLRWRPRPRSGAARRGRGGLDVGRRRPADDRDDVLRDHLRCAGAADAGRCGSVDRRHGALASRGRLRWHQRSLPRTPRRSPADERHL